MEPLNIQIRHDGTRRGTSVHAVRMPSDHRDSISSVFPAGLNVGTPLLERLDFNINADEAVASVVATYAPHATSIEVIADLGTPIPGRNTARIYVLSNGLLISTRVHDADTGESITCCGVRLSVAWDACRAWLVLPEPTAPGSWRARFRHGDWLAVNVVEREVHRDGADITTWRALIEGDDAEYDPIEFDAWEPVQPSTDATAPR